MLILFSFCVLETSCANKPTQEKPYDIYVPMFGGKVYKYGPAGSIKEEVDPNEIRGAMCMKLEDWEARELYIDKLRRGY